MSDHACDSAREPSHRNPGRAGVIVGGVGRRLGSPAWLSRAAAVGLCGTAIGLVGTLAVAIASHGRIALVTRPSPMRVALLLPYLVSVFAGGTLVGAMLAWWNRYWSLAARIHQTILALLGLGFVWQLAVLGFL